MQNAMNEINAARRLRVAALEKAEANKVGVDAAANTGKVRTAGTAVQRWEA